MLRESLPSRTTWVQLPSLSFLAGIEATEAMKGSGSHAFGPGEGWELGQGANLQFNLIIILSED